MKLGDVVRKLRKERLKTQQELASGIKVSARTIRRLEGHKPTSNDTLQGLYSYFNSPEEQKQLTNSSNLENSIEEVLVNNDMITLYEVDNANVIINELNKKPDYMACGYENIDKDLNHPDDSEDVLSVIEQCMEIIYNYKKELDEIQEEISNYAEINMPFNPENKLSELNLKTSFTLNRIINKMKNLITIKNVRGVIGEEPLYDSDPMSLIIFINTDGVINYGTYEYNEQPVIDYRTCPVIYICRSNHKGVIQKNKKQKILKITKSEVLPDYEPYYKYEPFIKHENE